MVQQHWQTCTGRVDQKAHLQLVQGLWVGLQADDDGGGTPPCPDPAAAQLEHPAQTSSLDGACKGAAKHRVGGLFRGISARRDLPRLMLPQTQGAWLPTRPQSAVATAAEQAWPGRSGAGLAASQRAPLPTMRKLCPWNNPGSPRSRRFRPLLGPPRQHGSPWARGFPWGSKREGLGSAVEQVGQQGTQAALLHSS